MKNMLRMEELAQFLVCLLALDYMEAPWWYFLILLLGPDIGMLGYIVSSQAGAFTYNVLHHKGIAMLLIGVGFIGMDTEPYLRISETGADFLIAGIILFGHASMDRIFGYGLKFGDNFHHTHLGWIGKGKVASGEASVGQ